MTPNSPAGTTAASRRLQPELVALLPRLRPGQHIRITQTLRVGLRTWQATVTGTFREFNSLATGLATERVPEDAIIIPIVHFTKEPHGELSSVALDEHTKIELIA